MTDTTHPADLVEDVARKFDPHAWRDVEGLPPIMRTALDARQHQARSKATAALDAQASWLARQPVAGDELVDREALGRIVRKVWVHYATVHGNTKPSHLASWDDLDEYDKEVDRQIGEAVAHHVLAARPVVPNAIVVDAILGEVEMAASDLYMIPEDGCRSVVIVNDTTGDRWTTVLEWVGSLRQATIAAVSGEASQ